MEAVSPGAACFGKLPTHGDFIRHHAGGRAMRTFDEWVQRGIGQARSSPNGTGEPEGEALCFFADVPGAPHALAGAFRPSRDRTGRRYPFLVAVEVEKRHVEGRRIPSWPARYRAFYDAAAALVDDAVVGHLAEGELAGRLQTLRSIYDATPFPVDYEFRLRKARARDLWARTWGDPEDGRKYVVLKNLTDALSRARSGRGRLPAALRFPLSDASDGLDVSFWLEACWRMLGTTPDQPAMFWTTPQAASGTLLLATAPPPRDLFMGGLATTDGTLALDDAGGQPAALAALALPAHVGRLLEEEALTLLDFIRRIDT